MNNTATQRRPLTKTQVRAIQKELERERQRLSRDDLRAHAVASALHRIELGTYGNCLTCGDRIPHERLEVVPETMYCVGCRSNHS